MRCHNNHLSMASPGPQDFQHGEGSRPSSQPAGPPVLPVTASQLSQSQARETQFPDTAPTVQHRSTAPPWEHHRHQRQSYLVRARHSPVRGAHSRHQEPAQTRPFPIRRVSIHQPRLTVARQHQTHRALRLSPQMIRRRICLAIRMRSRLESLWAKRLLHLHHR